MLARRVVSGVKRVVAGYGDAFVMTVRTTAPNETFTWPGRNQATDALFDWGDGTSDHITAYNQAELVHTYATAGDHDIQVTGVCGAPYFNNTGDKLKAINVKNWGGLVGATLWNNALYGCSNLIVDAIDTFGVGVTNASFMLADCRLFNQPVSNFVTDSFTKLSYMLANCSNFNQPITNFVTDNVSDISGFLRGCSLFDQPLSNLNLNKVSAANSFLYQCTSLSQANVDGLLQRLYQDRLLRTSPAPALVLPTAPSGTYQDASPPTTGKEYQWQLENGADVVYKWSITY